MGLVRLPDIRNFYTGLPHLETGANQTAIEKIKSVAIEAFRFIVQLANRHPVPFIITGVIAASLIIGGIFYACYKAYHPKGQLSTATKEIKQQIATTQKAQKAYFELLSGVDWEKRGEARLKLMEKHEKSLILSAARGVAAVNKVLKNIHLTDRALLKECQETLTLAYEASLLRLKVYYQTELSGGRATLSKMEEIGQMSHLFSWKLTDPLAFPLCHAGNAVRWSKEEPGQENPAAAEALHGLRNATVLPSFEALYEMTPEEICNYFSVASKTADYTTTAFAHSTKKSLAKNERSRFQSSYSVSGFIAYAVESEYEKAKQAAEFIARVGGHGSVGEQVSLFIKKREGIIALCMQANEIKPIDQTEKAFIERAQKVANDLELLRIKIRRYIPEEVDA